MRSNPRNWPVELITQEELTIAYLGGRIYSWKDDCYGCIQPGEIYEADSGEYYKLASVTKDKYAWIHLVMEKSS